MGEIDVLYVANSRKLHAETYHIFAFRLQFWHWAEP